jgi:ABC-type branched-subunit amino acid transport system ATPase component/ABC-type branched-subunit amino acid transport system permease subunit
MRIPPVIRIAGPLIALAVLAPLVLGEYYISLLNDIGLYTLVALGLVLLTGVGGLTSFGQAAFLGIGAYSTAIMTTRFGLTPWLGLPVALCMAGGVAVLLGLVTLRLSGHYLALLTVAWGMALNLLFGTLQSLGGHSGISEIPGLDLFGWSLVPVAHIYYLIWLLVGLSMLSLHVLLGSRQGRAIRALRGGAALVASLGIDAFRIRIAIFVIAAVLAGLAGWIFAHMARYVGPVPFEISAGIQFLLMAVLGGAGSVWGALIGAFVMTVMGSVLQDVLPLFTTHAANMELVFYGILFIAILQYAPTGISAPLSRFLLVPAARRTGTATLLARRTLPKAGTPLLQVDDLSKRFGGLLALENISFEVRTGEIVGLIGPNGAGKSTTFNLISRLLRPTSGRVRFQGKDLAATPASALAALGLSRTFQHVKLRPRMTLLENVMLGAYCRTDTGFFEGALHLGRANEDSVRAEAFAQLERIGLAEQANQLAGNLALGQQRTLEIARALASDPVMIFLDEPAAGLRRLEKAALSDVLRGLKAQGMTLLLVEHDMEFVMDLVDRIVVLDFGRKLAEGLPAEIRASAAVQEAYLGGVA